MTDGHFRVNCLLHWDMAFQATSLEQALDQHTTLPNLTLVQLLPSVNRANLYTDHGLVAIIRREVAHRLGLLDPRVPSNSVLNIVADDVEARLTVLQNRSSILRDGAVDAIDLACELERVVRLCVNRCVENLINVFNA